MRAAGHVFSFLYFPREVMTRTLSPLHCSENYSLTWNLPESVSKKLRVLQPFQQ